MKSFLVTQSHVNFCFLLLFPPSAYSENVFGAQLHVPQYNDQWTLFYLLVEFGLHLIFIVNSLQYERHATHSLTINAGQINRKSKFLIVDSLHKINSDTNLHLKLFHVLCTNYVFLCTNLLTMLYHEMLF